ncbi:MAG: DUF58 domain-containing protein, partial [Acidobacteria bacterium]|nr:DUF58 domain-containing protein [Acidobacteriota bacterium]
MTASETLIPAAVTAAAERHSRLSAAFGPRFFILILIGLVWLGVAFHYRTFYYAVAAWDLLVLTAWAVDLARLPAPRQLSVTRRWSAPAALSVGGAIELALENASSKTVVAAAIDNVPPSLRFEAPEVELKCGPRAWAAASYQIRPGRRGNIDVGAVYLRYRSPLRIAERWAVAHSEQRICVYPNLEEAREQSVYLIRSRQIELEKRHTRIRGTGREFESLREYREGDDSRDICWTASARRSKLVTRLFQVERSQTVWLVVDAGRLMRARVAELSKLDISVNAALSLSEVALGTGDRVGLLAYGRQVRKRMLPYRGSPHLRRLIEQLAQVREEGVEGNHFEAASVLLSTQKRRSLVVWLTDFPETAMTPDVIEAASAALSRHLVLFVVIGQPDLAAVAAQEPDSLSTMYRATAAQQA